MIQLGQFEILQSAKARVCCQEGGLMSQSWTQKYQKIGIVGWDVYRSV